MRFRDLSRGSAFTGKMAEKHTRPLLHLDLDKMSVSYAARMLQSWIIDNGIRVLNVAGPRASGDPEIYGMVTKVLESVLQH